MGAYTYINDQDIINWRKVEDDDVNEIFQEAREYDDSLMITQNYVEKWRLFKKPLRIKHFSVYHQSRHLGGNFSYEARFQASGSGEKRVVLAYLYGIMNGANANDKKK